MNKMIIAAIVLASVAFSTTMASAHRPTQPTMPHQVVKPDIAKTIFNKLERDGR